MLHDSAAPIGTIVMLAASDGLLARSKAPLGLLIKSGSEPGESALFLGHLGIPLTAITGFNRLSPRLRLNILGRTRRRHVRARNVLSGDRGPRIRGCAELAVRQPYRSRIFPS